MEPMSVKGHNGTVHFDGAFVEIERKGFLARTSVGKGSKRIPVSSIAAIQIKPGGAISNGFIAFTVPGGNEVRSRAGSQTKSAVHDENSVVITKAQTPEFLRLRDAIEAAMHAPQAPAASSDADELRKLAELRDSGILTDEEFAAKKAQILGV